MNTHVDIDALVERAARGDANAFRAIYEHLAPRLHRFVLVRIRERDDAEDLVQRVFLKMIEALPRYEQRGVPFAAWVFRLARNTLIDFERTRRPQAPLDEIADRPDDVAGPAELVELEADRAAVRHAMTFLTPEQQDVVTYRFFAGLSPAEIGALMGRREGSVRALQFRALTALRSRLGPVRAFATDDAAAADLDPLQAGAQVES